MRSENSWIWWDCRLGLAEELGPKRMQIAIFMRGPFRPDVNSGLARARALADEVRANGHEPVLFFATWTIEDRAALSTLAAQPDVGNMLVIEPPSLDYIHDVCGVHLLRDGGAVRNVFYQHYQARIGLQVIASMGRFDYVIHSRPDVDIRLGVHFPHWLRDGAYSTIHGRANGKAFINDQFGVATTVNMLATWDYGTIENLGDLIRNAKIAEDVLERLFADTGLEQRIVPLELWQLDPRRHNA